jgi:signal transduction histidine kinase
MRNEVDQLIGQNISRFNLRIDDITGGDVVSKGPHMVSRSGIKSAQICEQIICNNDQVEIFVEMSIAKMQVGCDDQYTLIIRDITKRKESEEKLSKSHRMESLGRMSAGVFHEILNPVNIISCGIQSLLIDEKTDTKIKEDLEIFQGEIDRITKITRGMLDFSRSNTNETEKCLVNDIVKEALSVHSPELRLKRIEVVENYSDNIPVCKLNKYSLRQVFLNIINNAKDAMDGGGILEISTKLIKKPANKSLIRIKFSDTGSGISSEIIGMVFDPFFTTKAEGEGTGLGLSESYKIVEAHDGVMHVESTLGEGTCFVIDLPLH